MSACARLQTATGFGELPADWFLECLKVVEGLTVAATGSNRGAGAPKLAPSAVRRTENAHGT